MSIISQEWGRRSQSMGKKPNNNTKYRFHGVGAEIPPHPTSVLRGGVGVGSYRVRYCTEYTLYTWINVHTWLKIVVNYCIFEYLFYQILLFTSLIWSIWPAVPSSGPCRCRSFLWRRVPVSSSAVWWLFGWCLVGCLRSVWGFQAGKYQEAYIVIYLYI